MNSKITFFFLLFASFIFLNATCNDAIPKEPAVKDKVTAVSKCIDKTKISPNKGCPEDINYVCGCDGKTYTNPCEAEKAGVIKTTRGECPCIDRSKINPNKACTKILKPVCGCDGKTYSNDCEAKKAGVNKWTNGKCNDKGNDCIDKSKVSNSDCPDEYAPVCGCDGKTYNNDCIARAAGVQRWDKGKCPDSNTSCIDKDKIDNTVVCGRVYKPVCGCNNVTYPNKCEAEKNGVTDWKEGTCKE